MYLTRIELSSIAEKIISECNHPDHPFDKEEQVRVCSIDLRVSNIFWKMKKRHRPVNLGAQNIFEVSPRRLWKKQIIEENGYILLKPGEMLLGRTYEKLNIPKEYVGKINTRSSYARLGISTACNCDLINPGYEGHVPLEITNNTKTTFFIHPYLPLCQIFLMKLDGEIDTSYTSEQFNSKYIDDDGGPSVWWRDKFVKKIATKNLNSQISDNTLVKLREKFEKIDDNGLFRLEKQIDKKQFSNSEELLQSFEQSESKLAFRYKIRRGVSRWLSPALLIPSLMFFQKISSGSSQPDFIMYIFWFFALAGFPFFLFYWFRPEVKFYDNVSE